MGSANKKAEVNQTQQTYARLAGGWFLGAILVGGGSVLSHIAGLHRVQRQVERCRKSQSPRSSAPIAKTAVSAKVPRVLIEGLASDSRRVGYQNGRYNRSSRGVW